MSNSILWLSGYWTILHLQSPLKVPSRWASQQISTSSWSPVGYCWFSRFSVVVSRTVYLAQYQHFIQCSNLTNVSISVAISNSTATSYTHNGCSGWISSPDFPATGNGNVSINYAIQVPNQHVSSELEHVVMGYLITKTEFCLSVCR